ncbi:membrane protein [Psychromonas marina]|uniref:Membrane protein n=1 Tax=Psychromonas marina TaxID=88364 RepID=A0ABQ6DUY2_9GAMM|nr:porin [Psychromonas marina]GLS88937.1 membrane protein [Psychromonas marina]
MKKTILAVAVISSLASATASAVTVYDNEGTKVSIGGRVEARGVFGNEFDGTMKDKSRARINFGVETKISENLTGFGFMEYQLGDAEKDLEARYLYAGLETQFGSFSYGKQDTSNVQISDMTDIASEHSGVQQIIEAASERQNNTFLYTGTFDALTVQVDYQAMDLDDADAFALSASYAFDFGLDIGASYSDQDEQNQATFGAAYTFSNLYLAATYSMGEYAEDFDFNGLEVAAQYKVNEKLRFIGIYANEDNDSETVIDYLAFEAQYRFNSVARTYVSYQIDLMDEGDDEVMVGLRYDF